MGIYLNKAANTKVLFNTLISTTGVDFRFPSTTGEAHGNVLSSAVRGRDSGSFTAGTNLMNVATTTWTTWYQAPLSGDLRLKGNVSQLIGAAAARATVRDDFCARPRPSAGAYTLGALEHSLGDCGAGTAPDGGTSPDAGAPTGIGDGNGQGSTGGGCNASPGLTAGFLFTLLPLYAVSRRRWRRAHPKAER